MGVDAELLIKYRGEKPTERQLFTWSWDLCRAIGARHFSINDGLPPPEYEVISAAWHNAFQAHPRYEEFKVSTVEARAEIYEAMLNDVGRVPQKRRRAIEFTNYVYPIEGEDEIPESFRSPGLCSLQDAEPIYAQPGEYFLEVALCTRYYDVDYERGDILTICNIAEWAEANMQPCEIWYGGDSGGATLRLFDANERERLKAHLFGPHGRDYFIYEKRGAFATPAPCSLCVPGESRFNRFGSGANFSAVSCAGCGKSFESRDGGETWAQRKGD